MAPSLQNFLSLASVLGLSRYSALPSTDVSGDSNQSQLSYGATASAGTSGTGTTPFWSRYNRGVSTLDPSRSRSAYSGILDGTTSRRSQSREGDHAAEQSDGHDKVSKELADALSYIADTLANENLTVS